MAEFKNYQINSEGYGDQSEFRCVFYMILIAT